MANPFSSGFPTKSAKRAVRPGVSSRDFAKARLRRSSRAIVSNAVGMVADMQGKIAYFAKFRIFHQCARASRSKIPKGFRPSAQHCRFRAPVLSLRVPEILNPKGGCAILNTDATPSGLIFRRPQTQGSPAAQSNPGLKDEIPLGFF